MCAALRFNTIAAYFIFLMCVTLFFANEYATLKVDLRE